MRSQQFPLYVPYARRPESHLRTSEALTYIPPPINQRRPTGHAVRRFNLLHIGPERQIPFPARQAHTLCRGGKIEHAEHAAVSEREPPGAGIEFHRCLAPART